MSSPLNVYYYKQILNFVKNNKHYQIKKEIPGRAISCSGKAGYLLTDDVGKHDIICMDQVEKYSRITEAGAVQEPMIISGLPPPRPDSAALISLAFARRSVCALPMT